MKYSYVICVLLALTEAKPNQAPSPVLPTHEGKQISPYIIGGSNAALGEFPFQASLRFVNGGGHTCGGSVISSRHVLTAAHCVVSGPLYVVVGTTTLNGGGTRYDLNRQFHHENYDPGSHWKNDIALLETNRNIEFGPNVGQAFLPANNVDGGLVSASGWGISVNDANWLPNDLQKLNDWPIVGLQDCKSRTGIDLYEGQICGGAQSGRGVCSGDSGGPLSTQGVVIGVTSFVFLPCGSGYPDFFTRVNTYNDWIFANTGKHAREIKLAQISL